MQQLLAGYLINAAWQIPVVALCALLVSRFGGLSPQARNRLWLLFLGIAAILPAVSLGALLPHAVPTVARVPAAATAMATFQAADLATDVLAPAAKPALELTEGSAWAMTALSAALVLILIVRLAIAALAARRLVRQSHPVVLPLAVAQELERLAQTHHRIAAPVRSSSRVSSPAVVGAISPVILIPDGLAVEDEDLRAALLHEMAHVVRNDYAINLACEVLTLPVCWHPALMALKAGVARSRELACDAMAAAALGSSKTYARRLVSLAQALGAQTLSRPNCPQPLNAALAVGLFGRSDLEDRLMQLMKPKDTEAPALRAARLCGLAAVGAGLLGSAVVLHVTPVFAQPATPVAAQPVSAQPVTAQPMAPPSRAVTTAASQAQTDTAKPDAAPDKAPAKRRGRVTITRHGIMMDSEPSGYHHTFVSSDGREFDVTSNDGKDLTPEEQRHFEETAAKAEAKAAEAMKRVNSPEFKARIAAAEQAGAQAEARVNSPEFKAKIAAARKAGAEAEARVNSPEFKARIAAVQAHAAEVEQMINSPEFKAKIARAAEAGARFNTPEFKARMDRMQRRLDEIYRDDTPATSPTTPTP
jgi:beta-lactamase regulating signal transducer with metallopeptidase domain